MTGSDGQFWLPAGTEVREGMPWPNPLGFKDERSVFAPVDIKSRWYHGWLAQGTPIVQRAGKTTTVRAIDTLRAAVGHYPSRHGRNKFGEPIGAYTAYEWLALNYTGVTDEWLAALEKSLRIPVARSVAGRERLARIRRIIINVCTADGKEVTMARIIKDRENMTVEQETKAEKKKVRAERVARKAAKKKAAGPKGAKTLSRVREQLASLKVPGKLVKLASDDASKKQLQTLRDGLNAHAITMRENKKAKAASQVSALNRLVRRLARSRR